MLPLRAILPIDAGPGLDRRAVRRRARPCRCTAFTVGPPFIAVLPFCTTVYPLVPLSDEPTASVTDEVREALEELVLHRRREDGRRARPPRTASDTSYSSPALLSASTSGRPIASPVIMITLTLLFADELPDPVRVELRRRGRSCCRRSCRPITPHCVAPCISGAIGNEVSGALPECPSRPSPRAGRPSCRSTRSMPPPSAKKTSSCRQTTPLGMPVVPPV